MFSCTQFAVRFIELENHRVAEVGRHCLWLSGPTPPLRGGLPRTGFLGPCPISFWVSPRMETPQPVQCLVILTIRKVFLMFQGNFLYLHLCPLPLGLSVGTTEKSVGLSSYSHHQVFICYPLEPALFLAKHSWLSRPLFIWEMLQSVGCLVAHCWTLSSMPMSFLYWGAQNRTQHPRCGLKYGLF